MSLEETIAANTAAIKELTLEIQAHLNVPAEVKETSIANHFVINSTSEPLSRQSQQEIAARLAGKIAETVVGMTPGAPLAADAGQIVTVTVQDVLALASKLIAKTDKATLQDTLKDFDLKGKKLSDITPEYLKPAYDKLTAALAACQQA